MLQRQKARKRPHKQNPPILSYTKNMNLLHFHLKHCRVTIVGVTSALLHTAMRHSQLKTFNKGAQV